jgi:Sulfotransferase family
VSGHFPLCTTEFLDGEFATLTVLRDPVERTLSYLRHQSEEPEGRGASLEEIYEDPWRFHTAIHNYMVKVLSLTPDEAAKGWVMAHVEFPPQRLERAKEALASMAAFGLQERFEEFCDELARRFGWDLGTPQRANPSGRAQASDAFRARIADDNAIDVELFEFATRLYEERRAPARSRS